MVEKVLTINTSRFTKFKLVDIVPITTAVIGAISGSLGTALVNDWRKRKSERLATYEDLINRYLFQVQDTAESLWHRFDNIANMGGRVIMENGYYEKSTLYALGCLLAYKRILLLDGVYSHMQQIKRKSSFGILLGEILYADRRTESCSIRLSRE